MIPVDGTPGMHATAVYLLSFLDLAFVALLPLIFFERGRLNLRWFLTALPFMVGLVTLGLAMAGLVAPVRIEAGWLAGLTLGGVVSCCGSIALIATTIGAHKVPLALWHQERDAPADIVMHGPYARVRHPFYSAFLLGLGGTVMILPHPITVAMLLYAAVALTLTAAHEERRLAGSDFGAKYRAYMRRTGRFLPRMGAGVRERA